MTQPAPDLSPAEVDAAARLLAQLVACPSVNPTRAVPSGPPYGEGAMARLLTALVSPLAAEVRTVEISPGRFNFLAHIDGASPRTLLLEAHADTVPVDGMTIPPFEPTVRDGRLYGRGSCDNKASLAAMLLALRAVCEGGKRPPATVWLAATADEELGSTGAHRLMADGFRADAAVVGEPTGLAVVHAHKGAYRFRVVTHGRAAHSSDPSRGTSAIAQMTRVVEALEGPVAARLRQRNHPLLGPPTISVGTIRGGSQVNIVPARCEIEVDRRTLPGENRDEIARPVVEQLNLLRQADPRFEYDYEEMEWYPAFEADPHGPLASHTAAACRAVLGEARIEVVPWAANAGIFYEAGIPSVLFGPGSIRQAHTADEWVDLAQVALAARVYAEIIRGF